MIIPELPPLFINVGYLQTADDRQNFETALAECGEDLRAFDSYLQEYDVDTPYEEDVLLPEDVMLPSVRACFHTLNYFLTKDVFGNWAIYRKA